MAVVSTGLTAAGIKAEFFEKFEHAGRSAIWPDLTTRIPSKTGSERYAFLGTVPPLREWGTGRKARGIRSETYDVENLKYEATIDVDRDELSDDQTGQIRLRIAELAARAASAKDAQLATLLINGAASGFNAYDGVTFFNANHVSGASGAQSNILTPAAVDASNPTTAEFRAALAAAIARMMGFKDDYGQPMSLTGTGLVCVVPPTMMMTALEAVNATLVASTTNVLQSAARIVTLPHLTSAAVWYLCKTDPPVRPFIFQDREPIEFGALEQDSDDGFKREVYSYGVRARYRITFGYWQYCIENTFTAA